jgi:hypothetical protein
MSAFGTPEIKKLIPKDVLQFFSKPFPVNQLGPVISEALAEGVPSGAVSGISVASFLLLVEMEKKTCLFEIELQEGKKGLCYFNKGILFNASFEGLRGEDAALSLLQHEKAKFSFKPLPDQKLGKLIDKDLGTLIREARRESAPVSEVQQLETPSEAPVEELEATLDISYEDMFNTEDLSGPLGEEPEHVLDLEGTYQAARKQIGGRMTVVNLCPSHIIFMIGEPRELVAGDELRLEFTLDDKLRSQVAKEVTVVHTRGRYLRCKFSTSYHYDRLGPYLHFNYLDKREI